ncbi:MAG: hypothetical protein EHM64_15890, partial [Ignavibacteriae bacterium]
MKSRTKNNIWKFAAAAILVMAVYNFFGNVLTEVFVMPVNAWYIAPFLLLLLSIAVMPFIDRHWWEKNYPLVAFVLGFIVVFYYSFSLHNTPRLFLTSDEYISFISLIG